MRNKLFLLTFIPFFLLHGICCAQAHSVVGDLRVVQVPGEGKSPARPICIWLPANYAEKTSEKFPVLYMLDGQNCFDRATSAFGKEWQIDETLTQLIDQKNLAPMVVVGIDSVGFPRIDEYTFVADPKYGGGKGKKFADVLLHQIKPYVEKNYHVRSDRDGNFIGGSSLGGLFVLEMARQHPGVFAGVIAMSPSVWWDDRQIMHEIARDPMGISQSRIWLDVGTHENPHATDAENARAVDDVRQLDAVLARQHVRHQFMVATGAEHDENAWAKRFPAAVPYITSHAAQ